MRWRGGVDCGEKRHKMNRAFVMLNWTVLWASINSLAEDIMSTSIYGVTLLDPCLYCRSALKLWCRAISFCSFTFSFRVLCCNSSGNLWTSIPAKSHKPNRDKNGLPYFAQRAVLICHYDTVDIKIPIWLRRLLALSVYPKSPAPALSLPPKIHLRKIYPHFDNVGAGLLVL